LYSRAKKFVFLGVKRNMKGYKLWDPENKKIVLSKHVAFDETSLSKSTISQQVERLKTKDVSQRVEVDATQQSLVGLVSARIPPDVTRGEDHVFMRDTKQVKLIAAKGIKLNPRKWVKKHKPQVG